MNAALSPGAEAAGQLGSHLSIRGLPAHLDLDLTAGLREYGGARTLDGGLALGRSAGRAHARASWRMERGAEREPATVHEIAADASLAVGRRNAVGLYAVHSAARRASGTLMHIRFTMGF
jgi:hypothetical protein